jgi:hypothetical protein
MSNPLPRRAAENPTQYNIEAIAKLDTMPSGAELPPSDLAT